MAQASRAPIFTAAWDLAAGILQRLGGDASVLARSLCAESLGLLDAVVLALKDIERLQHLDRADTLLIQLRLRLRLTAEVGLLEQRQALFLLAQADDLGRQIGGWLKSLDQA
jgi:hypothetical protein